MNITKENIDDLNAVLKVKIEKEDYQEKVDEQLKEYRKKANMPGFRPGKVPFGMVKKMYGKTVLLEEINKLISESIGQYISENKLNILGEPLPSEKEQPQNDWDNQEEFEFAFDIALAPEFDLEVSEKDKIPYYEISVDDEMIDEQVKSYAQHHGYFENKEVVEDGKELLTGDFVELDENGEQKEPGIQTEDTSISLELMKDDQTKEKAVGAKPGDTLEFDVRKAYPNDTEVSSMLKIEKADVETLKEPFRFTIKEIKVYKPAEMNQEFFDKVFGEGEVESEEAFRKKIEEQIKNQLEHQSNRKFDDDAKQYFIDKVDVELPEEFLKRWLRTSNKQEDLSDEDLEKEFPRFKEDLKWQLIQNKIIKDNDMKVSEEEVQETARNVVRMQLMQYGMMDLPDEQIDSFANEMLKKEDDKRRLYDSKYQEKVFDYIKENVKMQNKKVTREEFDKMNEKDQS